MDDSNNSKLSLNGATQEQLKINADYSMILEFMNQISLFSNLEVMIQKSLVFFHTLFSPKVVIYYDLAKDNKIYQYKFDNNTFSHGFSSLPIKIPPKNQIYIWGESESDLIISIQAKDMPIGYLSLNDFQFAKYKSRYLHLLLLITKYWGRIFENMALNKQIQFEQERFRIVANYSLDWEVWFDESGILKYNSPSCKRITGYSTDTIHNFFEFMRLILHPNDLVNWKSYVSNIHLMKSGSPIEVRIINPKGELRWLHLICQKISSEPEGFLGYRGSLRDITERKEAENNISILKGLLPICSFCKKIRSDQGYWERIEDYIRDHSEAEFTHSLCPPCAKKEYGIDY